MAINAIASTPGNADYQLIIYGDQSDASSVIFYTHHQALLAHGSTSYFEPRLGKDGHPREATFGSSMIWGHDYPDAPHIFMADPQLLAKWGTGPRIFLFVPGEFHDHVEQLLAANGKNLYKLQELSDKTLYTDRPL